MKHPIPDEVLTDHLAILAKTGAGKTFLAKGIVERLLEKKLRVCIVDPKNAWWGLKSSADGKSPGFEIIVFGGPNADVPLLAQHGKVLGEAVATGHLSCIICTKGMPEGERIRFLTDFFQTLDMKNSEPLHLVLDEAHMMAPQKPLGEMQRLTHWTSELVSGGRGMGFRILLISQRPARLNKDVLTQCEALVAMRMTGPQDRDAVKAWIEDQADREKGKEIIASLPSLPTGEGWFWAPTRGILERHKFPRITTYDNSRTKKDGTADAKAKLAPVDLAVLEQRLGKVKAEIDAIDPKALQRQVAELKKQLAAKLPAAVPKDEKSKAADIARGALAAKREGDRLLAAAQKEVLKRVEEMKRKLSQILAGMAKNAEAVERHLELLRSAAAEITKATDMTFPELNQRIAEIEKVVTKGLPVPDAPADVGSRTRAPRPAPAREAAPADGVTRPQQKVLDALAWWAAAGHEQPSREQVAGVAGYSPTSGGFNNLIGQLNTAGWATIPAPGMLALTDTGRAIAMCEDLPTTEDLQQRAQGVLTNPQWKLMAALIEAHPNALTRDNLGEATGYSPSSGGFNNLIGSLSTLRMIEKPQPGSVRAADWLFIG